MTLHFSVIPAQSPQPAQDELNRFCLAHRVVNIERQFIADGANAYWALGVTLAVADATLPDLNRKVSQLNLKVRHARWDAVIQCHGRLASSYPCSLDSGNPCRNDVFCDFA